MNTISQKKKKFLDLYRKKNYNVAKTCRDMNISRSTYYSWTHRYKDFARAIEDIQEEDIDDSEEIMRVMRKGIPKLNEDGKFIGWITKPDVVANIFFLKTKGKGRGYVEKYEIENRVTEPLEVRVITPEKSNIKVT